MLGHHLFELFQTLRMQLVLLHEHGESFGHDASDVHLPDVIANGLGRCLPCDNVNAIAFAVADGPYSVGGPRHVFPCVAICKKDVTAFGRFVWRSPDELLDVAFHVPLGNVPGVLDVADFPFLLLAMDCVRGNHLCTKTQFAQFLLQPHGIRGRLDQSEGFQRDMALVGCCHGADIEALDLFEQHRIPRVRPFPHGDGDLYGMRIHSDHVSGTSADVPNCRIDLLFVGHFATFLNC